MNRWPLLLAAAAALLGASLKYPSEHSSALVGAGLVSFGAWIAVEVGDFINRRKGKDTPDGQQ